MVVIFLKMKFYSKSGQYFWEIDRFQLFTESEKCSLLAGLKTERSVWSGIEEANEEGGIVEMLDKLIKEVNESLK